MEYKSVIYEYNNSKNNTQITFFGFKWETENVRTIERLITEFMEQNAKINVLYESIKGQAYFPALKKRLLTGHGDDIFMINQDMLVELARKEYFVDLSDMPELDNYSALALSQIRNKNGAVFALPTSISAFGLYCNLDLLRDYHLSPPKNLAEFLAACKIFRDAGVTPIIANNDISLKTLAMARGMPAFYRAGEKAFSLVNTGRLPLSAYFRSGFELLSRLCDQGYIDRRRALATRKTREDLTEFAQGTSPFMLTGVWASVRLKKLARFPYAILPYPVQEDGTILVANIDTRLALNAHGKHPDAAKAFLRYLIRPDAVSRFCAGQASFSPLKNGPPPDPSLRAVAENFANGRVILGADSHFAFPIWEISRIAARRILEGATTEDALRYLDDAVSRALSEAEP